MNQAPYMQYTVEKKVYKNYNKELVLLRPPPGLVKDHTLTFFLLTLSLSNNNNNNNNFISGGKLIKNMH